MPAVVRAFLRVPGTCEKFSLRRTVFLRSVQVREEASMATTKDDSTKAAPAKAAAPAKVAEPAAKETPAKTAEPTPAPVAVDEKPADGPRVSDCVVNDGRGMHVGRAVNGKVCSYHAMHYHRDGTRR